MKGFSMHHALRQATGGRRFRRTTLVAACVGALAVIAGPATASSYTITANGTPVTTTTTTGGENANLTFAGTAGNRIAMRIYGVTMSPKPNTGIKVSIQKPDGTTLVSPFDVGSAGTWMEPVTTPVNGTYKLVLDGQSTYKGKATVAIWTVPNDANGGSTTPGGAAVPLAMGTPGMNGSFQFAGTAGQRVSLKLSGVTITGNALNSARVSVLNPDNTVLVANTSFGSSGAFLEPVTLPATGNYTVKIDPRQWYVGSATTTVYSVSADQAGTITAGTPLPLTFAAGSPGQNATETFSGTAGQKVSLNLTNVTIGANTLSGTKVSIVTGSTTVVAATDVGTNGKFIEPVTLPLTASYTIKVDPQGANTGGITLSLANFAGDTTGTITANGTPTVVTSSAAGQNGSLTFTGSVNQRIALNLSTNFGTLFSGARVWVKSPTNTTVVAPVTVGTNGTFVEPVTLTAAGTYTVRIDPDSAYTGNVTVSLYTVPADTSAAITAGGAGVVATNTVPGQNMKLTFTAGTNQKVSIKMTSVSIGSNAISGTNVTLMKGSTTVGLPTAVGTNGGFIDTSAVLTAGATYTIKIDPQGVNTGSMTVNLYTVPADATGTILTTGAATVVSNTVPGQNIVYSFTGTLNQRISLDLSSVSIGSSPGGGTLVTILKPDGTTFYGPFSLGTDGAFTDTKVLPVAGTYKIKLDPIGANTGSATLKLYTVPADISTTITKNGANVVTTTTVPGQNAVVTFSGVATDPPYTLSLGPITVPVAVTITGPTGAVVVDTNLNPIQNSTFLSDASTAPFQIPTNGTYTIKIDYLDNGVGATTLSLIG
jgi:acetyltransferase-like isoleucine patch superfamily enzyme